MLDPATLSTLEVREKQEEDIRERKEEQETRKGEIHTEDQPIQDRRDS